MSLLSGAKLDPSKYFSSGQPTVRGTAFNLTIGTIFDPDGKEVDGCYSLKPGHMVQVISKEIFSLPHNVTGHVTYKTGLTRIGIWALTVGIVDSGWNGPVSTTLLNFSKVEYAVKLGETFLRVSLYEHDEVSPFKLESLEAYKRDIQGAAMATFPPTFLNQEDIADKAGNTVLGKIRDQALTWVVGVAILFTIIQFGIDFVRERVAQNTSDQMQQMRHQIDDLAAKLKHIESVPQQHRGGKKA